MNVLARWVVLTAANAACESRPAAASAHEAFEASAAPAAEATKRARSAVRCGECHGGIAETWQVSAHGRAATSPTYLAAAAQSGDPSCVACHAPLAAALGPDHATAAEGVTCEVCHKTTSVSIEGGGAFSLDLLGNVEFGTLCDAGDHYFHRAQCRPLQSESRLCAGCHQWTRKLADGVELPVLSEYADWASSSFAEAGVQCQDCHMPGRAGEVATGWQPRPSVPRHDNPTKAERGRAVTLAATAQRKGENVDVEIELHNAEAGHAVPTGLPGTRLHLEVEFLDALDRVVAVQTADYGRTVVGAGGEAAAFWNGAAIALDTRLQAGERRRETMRLTDRTIAAIRVRLTWRAAPELIGPSASAPQVLVREQRIELDELPPPGVR